MKPSKKSALLLCLAAAAILFSLWYTRPRSFSQLVADPAQVISATAVVRGSNNISIMHYAAEGEPLEPFLNALNGVTYRKPLVPLYDSSHFRTLGIMLDYADGSSQWLYFSRGALNLGQGKNIYSYSNAVSQESLIRLVEDTWTHTGGPNIP